MRKTTLYQITKSEVLAGDFVTLRQMEIAPNAIWRAGENDFIHPLAEVNIPVDRVYKIKDGKRTDQYIAIHPELREILEAPYAAAKDAAERRESAGRELVIGYEMRIGEFNSLPWFKRIFKKV